MEMRGTEEKNLEVSGVRQDESEKVIAPFSASEENSSTNNDLTKEEMQDEKDAVEDESGVHCDADTESEEQPQEVSAEKEVARELDVPKDDVHLKEISTLKDDIAELKDMMGRTFSEVKEVHKLYHNEYAGRLGKMQKELDEYHEMANNRIFDDILLDIAKVYCDNEPILDAIEDPKIKKQVGYIFDDIEQVLESYGVQRNKSQIGDKRDIKNTKIQKTVETNAPEFNDTVERSLKSGFSKGNRVLIKEDIYVNVYKENTINHASASEMQDATNPEETTD